MRCLDKNKFGFYYADYLGVTEVTDSDGNYTGERTVNYSYPTYYRANISGAKGTAEVEPFGAAVNYDKVIVTRRPILDEHSILWIDTMPTLDESGATDTPHDYVVVRKAVLKQSVLYAVRKVEVSGN